MSHLPHSYIFPRQSLEIFLLLSQKYSNISKLTVFAPYQTFSGCYPRYSSQHCRQNKHQQFTIISGCLTTELAEVMFALTVTLRTTTTTTTSRYRSLFHFSRCPRPSSLPPFVLLCIAPRVASPIGTNQTPNGFDTPPTHDNDPSIPRPVQPSCAPEWPKAEPPLLRRFAHEV